jgi:hypothetical protein
VVQRLGALTTKVDSFQELSDEALVGSAAGAAFLLAAGYDRAWFKGKSDDYLRNEVIVQNGEHAGRTDLQAMSNQQLVGVGLEWFDWPKERFGALSGDDQRAIIQQICVFLAKQLAANLQSSGGRGRVRTAPMPLWNGIDMVVNVTNDGVQGYLFKGSKYYKYALGKDGFTKVEGPSSTSVDFPGLWQRNVTAAFTGDQDRVFVFQKQGTYDDHYQNHPPQYMVYNFNTKKIEPGYPKSIADDWPGLMGDDFTLGTDRAMAAALLQSANSLSKCLEKERDYFGNTSTYVALETVAFFDKAKKEALELLQSAEDDYHSYQAAMNKSAQSQAGLQLAVSIASSRKTDIEDEAKKTLERSAAALAKINQLRDLLDAKGKALAHDAGDLKDRVKTAWGVSWQDMFGCLTQFSFQHWGNLPEKIESGPALMATGQVGDLFQKGISNVVSDSGQSLSKDYVVKQVDSLTSGVRSLKDLTLNRSKFIDQTNLYNDTYKLMVTRDQFKALCSDFTRTFSVAQKVIDDLDEYVTLADQRNAAVLDYNQLWQRVYDLQAEAVKAELDLHHAQSGIAKKAQPHLPVFTSFATERYNRAKDQTLQIYYLASRASVLKSLEVRNLFSDMLSQLPATGQIDAATFSQAKLDYLYNRVMDKLRSAGPAGPCAAHLVFQKRSHPQIFESLARDGLAAFTIRAPRKGTIAPFSGMANVRLTRVRCWAGGLAPKKEHYFKLVHTGRETFVTSDGAEVIVDHKWVHLDYKYRADRPIDPTVDDFKFKGYEEPMPLTGEFALIGPFTTWNVVIDDEDDRAKIDSLRVEFDAMHQTSKPKTH